MLLLSALWELLAFFAGLTVRARLGAVGVMLMFTVAVGVRARHDVLAVGAAVVLVLLLLRPV
ncbi:MULTISPECIES: hypothetical protein [Streptomyces]|uniref:Histidine kinase n=1 Tax=Streptomyces asoensis TaxID=249586 RepID=A0ABQ3S166_9ACTN|nr:MULTISPECIES: hypothetical protein [Streptomyces]MBK3629924.1 hypothetical protein [Streptomyces sp. MBT49]GGQ63281.1 hypothetical protein GCM10010496_28410 [Streptomyces asoensis]GHI61856.1 hypothetical protein Saso_35060 [Streptomyces asoensis]